MVENKVYVNIHPANFLVNLSHAEFNFGETITGLILGLCPVNERRRYKVTPSLIGCVQT